MTKFVPYDYLYDEEIREANILRKKIAQASSIQEIKLYENDMKNLIKLAYMRKLEGKEVRKKTVTS